MLEDQNQKIQELAKTLFKTKLATSQTEATRMAQSILGIEKKVSASFERFNEDRKPKMSLQEEMDYLIEKTNPNSKKHHIPINGFPSSTKDVKEIDEFIEKLEAKKPVEAEKTKLESPAESDVSQIIEPEEQSAVSDGPMLAEGEADSKEIAPEIVSESVLQNVPEENVAGEPLSEAGQEESIEITPVYTDEPYDERPLAMVMDEDNLHLTNESGLNSLQKPEEEQPETLLADDIMRPNTLLDNAEMLTNSNELIKNSEEPVEYNIIKIDFGEPENEAGNDTIALSERADSDVSAQPESNDDFIVKFDSAQKAQQEEPKRSFKNPIEKIDLSEHFRVG